MDYMAVKQSLKFAKLKTYKNTTFPHFSKLIQANKLIDN